jgi:hypothetical protein
MNLFLKQMELLAALKDTLNLIKNSRLYKMEKGEVPVDKANGINIGTIHGKVNINSTDKSTTIIVNQLEVFDNVKGAIIKSKIEQTDKDLILSKLDEMQKSCGRSDFIIRYNEFIQAAANHITIIAPFIPALTKLIGLTTG